MKLIMGELMRTLYRVRKQLERKTLSEEERDMYQSMYENITYMIDELKEKIDEKEALKECKECSLQWGEIK